MNILAKTTNDLYSELTVALSGAVLGRGNAEAAAELVVAHLPPGCGPVAPGTAEGLDGVEKEER